VLAERYANATRAGLEAQARELAKSAHTAADLEPIRKLYHRSKQIEDTLARWNDSSLQSLRLAVEDLSHTYGSRYAGGPQYLQRITEIEKTIAEARRTAGDAVGFDDEEGAFHTRVLCESKKTGRSMLRPYRKQKEVRAG